MDPTEILALDIDKAVTLVLRDYDAECNRAMWGGGESSSTEDLSGVEVL